jgi:tetratricopeptide (TPR) repeat protein
MILRLNYAALPLWLDIGLCQYFGNTVVESGEIGVGHINKWQLQLLRRTPLIPVKTLIDADQRSPLYNEQDHASMFYAESWMLVHFLMGDPDARKAQTFSHFLKVYEETNDTDQAAIQAFGNLGHLEVQLQEYARQTQFRYQRFPSKASISANDYTSRPLSPPEALALHGDFLAHSGHAKEAKELLQEAVKQQPTLASAFTSLGWVHYQLHDNEAAQAALDQAISLDPQNFVPYHFRALLLLRVSGYRKDSTPQIIADLEKVTALNPSFAPAYGFLSVAYRQQDASKAKSLPAALKAAKLQPANFAFSVDVGDSLLAENHDQEAAKFLDRLNKAARSPNEKSMVESFAKRLAAHRDTASQKSAAVPPASASSDPGDSSGGSSAAKISVSAQEGIIRDASCSSSPLNVQFAILGETLSLAISDLANLPIRVAGKNASLSENPCQQWKGRKARISYSPAADNSPSEISSIDFF